MEQWYAYSYLTYVYYVGITDILGLLFIVQWELRSNESCRQTVGTCSTDVSPQQNYLISSFINSSEVLPLSIGITVEFKGDCEPPASCTTDFSLLISTSSPSQSMDVSSYTEIVQVVPNNTEIFYSFPVQESGFFLAFRDESACVVIDRVRVYVSCSGTVNGFAQYAETISGRTIDGTCVDNAVLQTGASLNALCQLNGTFNFPSSGPCHCRPGYGSDGNNTCSGEL